MAHAPTCDLLRDGRRPCNCGYETYNAMVIARNVRLYGANLGDASIPDAVHQAVMDAFKKWKALTPEERRSHPFYSSTR